MTPGADLLRDLADAFNARDFDRAHQLLSEDLVFEDLAMGETTHGIDGFIEYAKGFARAFSDMRLETRSSISQGVHAAAEFFGRGTHDGPLPTPSGEIPATGKHIDTPFVWYADIADGKITALRDYYNAMTIMTQLGLMPETASAA